MKLTTAISLIFPALLLVPAARAVDVTPWDAMPAGVEGSISVKLKSGKKLKSEAAYFSAATITLDGSVIPREEVREVTVRAVRSTCCDVLWLGAEGVALGVGEMAGGEAAFGFAITLISAPIAAVTLPPALAIEGIRRLKPAKVLYKVSP
jgi:hypothetical protein